MSVGLDRARMQGMAATGEVSRAKFGCKEVQTEDSRWDETVGGETGGNLFIHATQSMAPSFLQISIFLASIAVWQQMFMSTYCMPDVGLGTGDTEKRHRPYPGGVHSPVEKSESHIPRQRS